MKRHIVLTVNVALMFACAASFAADPAILGEKGPYEVGFTSFILTDTTRPGDGVYPGFPNPQYPNRPIPVYVWYPVDPGSINGTTPEALYPLDPLYDMAPVSTSSNWEAYGMDRAYQEPMPSQAGPFPMVVFSPGWGFTPWFHISNGTRLASHGFVVAVVYHFGDQWWPWEPPYDHIALACWNRPRDMSYVLTDLLAKNQQPGDLFHGLLRPDRVAASGHSLGGYASMVLAAGDDSVCDIFYEPGWEWAGPVPEETCTPSYPDPRIKAIVPLDGSNQCLWFTELARVEIPAMGMGEEWNMVESWQARQHAAFSGRPAYRVDVWDTNHQSFCDLCEGLHVMLDYGIDTLWYEGDVYDWISWMCMDLTPSVDVHRLVNQYTMAFLTSYVVGRNDYRRMLTPGYAQHDPLVEFFVTERRNPHAINDDWPDDFIYFKHQPGNEVDHGPRNPEEAMPVFRMSAAVDRGVAFSRPLERVTASLGLNANPNPFNPGTKITYEVSVAGQVKLQVFDLRGRLVTTLVDESLSAGGHEVQWNGRTDDGREQASGVYLVRLQSGGQMAVNRMTLTR